MPRFKTYDYSQHIMCVINLEEQLQSGTFEHAIHYLIENKLNLCGFAEDIHNDATGRPAYDPALLLKIILFAYSKGITSSRVIEWCCLTNIVFKALSCDLIPHWTTIAHFVSSHTDAIASVFEQILLICDEQGLLGHELLAIDGCKMPSNAAKEWSGTIKELNGKHAKIKRHIAYHLEQHRIHDLQDHRDQAAPHERAIDTLSKAADKIEKFLDEAEPRMGQGKQAKEVKSNITNNESAKMKTSKGTIQGYNGVATVDKKHQIIVDASAFGEGPEQHTLQPVLEAIDERYRRLGINDQILQEAIFVADTGFANEANMQYLKENGINGYIPDNHFRSRDTRFKDKPAKHPRTDRQTKSVILASEFDFDPIKQTCHCPANNEMRFCQERVNKDGMPTVYFEGKLNNCRHCSLKVQCMRNPASADPSKGHGRQVSFALSEKRPANYTDWMKHRVDSELGKEIYGHRMSVVEPIFGNIEHNKGLKRFGLRGKKKVTGQWQLFCLVHNIEKIKGYGQIAA